MKKIDYLDKMNEIDDMLKGNINRIFVSDEKREIEFMIKVAKARIDKMGEYALRKLEGEK